MGDLVRKWLPEGHPASSEVDAVSQLGLSASCALDRVDAYARRACDPAMMVALVLYAYTRGTRCRTRHPDR